MTTWTKETDKIFLELWGHGSPAEIATVVNNWHSGNSRAKGHRLAPMTTARGVMYRALKHGLVSSAEVSAFDQQQKSDRAKRGYVSNEVRQAMIQRDGNKCLLCGSQDNLTVGHIIPISRGGNSDIENLQTLCFSCGRSVQTSSVDFRKPHVKQWCDNCGREHYKNVE
ncbi:MAG: HNH endonuclease [Anaerolineales bacterium]|nr:HNH endonuclease [Anaerolineales bacterium]